MIYIETGSTDACYNFALEYYFAAVKKLNEPVFLFWRTGPTLMVGKYQNTLEEINRDYAEKHGIQVVRRLSGGGTIYTDLGGWQFTFIEYGDTDEIHFHEYIEPVIDALRALDVPASFNGRNDLLIDGRKFSGNAQYKLAGSTVHHGSLLFNTNIEQMVASTTVDEYKIISKSIRSVRERVTNISEHLKTPMDAEAFKRHMISYIMKGDERCYTPAAEDDEAIRRIALEQFDSWQSRYGMNPKFDIVRTGRCAGGKIEFRLEVKKGIIVQAVVNGDFFAGEKADGLAQALIGCPFDGTALRNRLETGGFEGAVYGISIEDMVSALSV